MYFKLNIKMVQVESENSEPTYSIFSVHKTSHLHIKLWSTDEMCVCVVLGAHVKYINVIKLNPRLGM